VDVEREARLQHAVQHAPYAAGGLLEDEELVGRDERHRGRLRESALGTDVGDGEVRVRHRLRAGLRGGEQEDDRIRAQPEAARRTSRTAVGTNG
jgi:hypothetical protein